MVGGMGGQNPNGTYEAISISGVATGRYMIIYIIYTILSGVYVQM